MDTTKFVNLTAYAERKEVIGKVITVLDAMAESRGLWLISTYSRAVPKYSIHELILTDEAEPKPGEAVNRIAYLCFFEVAEGGVIPVGDKLYLNDQFIGTIKGFDETHLPNHLNIIVYAEKRQTGKELGFTLGAQLSFKPK
ncbi:MAG: hypothetical protein N3A72_05530 [bacterium]|nr:hypothetical protein [bacterium]